jgi:hypothetical protein
LWHETSLDNGETWTRISPASIFAGTVGSPSLTWDSFGRLHLLQMVSRSLQAYVLQHWMWDGERWSTERSVDMQTAGAMEIESLASNVSKDNNLAVIFTGKMTSKETNLTTDNLYFTSRQLGQPQTVITPRAAMPTATRRAPTPTPTPAPSATPTVNISQMTTEIPTLPAGANAGGGMTVTAVVIPVIAGVVILAVLLIGARRFGQR